MMRASTLIFISLLLLITLSGPARGQEKAVLRIMPCGDSITDGAAGSTDDTGYRRSLFQQLTGAGYTVQFVGGQTSGIPLDFDRDHEGHSGWQADQVRDNIYNWLVANPADIVLLHIGTNDVSYGNEDVQEVVDILDNIDQYEADYATPVMVLLALIILRDDSLNPETIAYNDAVETMALLRQFNGDDVFVVNQEDRLTYPDDLADPVHPNDSGYQEMADEWFAVLNYFLSTWGDQWVSNVTLEATSPGNLTTDDLICSYFLMGDATTAATAWFSYGTPLMSAYLPMEGGASNALLDYSGTGNHGSPGSDPNWSSTGGRDSHGFFVLDGDDFIDLGNPMPSGVAYSKAAWVYWTPGEYMNNILSGDSGHALWVSSYPEGTAGSPVTDYYLSAGHSDPWRDVKDTSSFPPNQWVHVAVTYDHAVDGGTMILYRNGAEVDRTTGLGANVDTRAFVGAFRTSGPYFLGGLDDARIYRRAISPGQVASLHGPGRDVIDSEETRPGENWQAQVTPFSASAAGLTVNSNELKIQSASGPIVESVVLVSWSLEDLTTDSLICGYSLSRAVTAATAWSRNGMQIMSAYLPMEGGVSNAPLDYSGSGNHGSLGGDPSWAVVGGHDMKGYYYLDGNDYIDLGNPMPSGGAYSKVVWVYWTPGSYMNNILSGNSGHALWVTSYPEGSEGSPITDYYLSAGHSDPWRDVKDTSSFPSNQWVHVAVTYDPAVDGGTMILYRDGAEVDRVTGLGDNLDTQAFVGAFRTSGPYFEGGLDDARIYKHALSSSQVFSLYDTGHNVIMPEETVVGDQWQAQVTPFSGDADGTTVASNTLTIQPDSTPTIGSIELVSSSGNDVATDDLICYYSVTGGAVTAATAWYRGSPIMSAYLPMEGGANNAPVDYSGSGNHGSPCGDPDWSASGGHDVRGCYDLDGNDYIDLGDPMPSGGAYTKAVWVYWTPGEYMNNILSGHSGHALWVTSYPEGTAGSPVTEYYLSAGHSDPWRDVKDTSSFPPSQWVHVAVTYDPAVGGGTMILYRDGSEVDRTTGLAPSVDTQAFVGAFRTIGPYFLGRLDDARIYFHALSPDQIDALTSGGNTIVAAETEIGDLWVALVTPFSEAGVGPTVASNGISILDPSPVLDEPLLPGSFVLHNPEPNPFNPVTVIKYDLPVATHVSLKVLDVSGRLITVLKEGVFESAGRHEAVWDGRDVAGRMCSAGVYLYRLEADDFHESKRMTLVK